MGCPPLCPPSAVVAPLVLQTGDVSPCDPPKADGRDEDGTGEGVALSPHEEGGGTGGGAVGIG